MADNGTSCSLGTCVTSCSVLPLIQLFTDLSTINWQASQWPNQQNCSTLHGAHSGNLSIAHVLQMQALFSVLTHCRCKCIAEGDEEQRQTLRTCKAYGEQESKSVKYTLLQALRLCTGRSAHRGSRGIALLFLDHGTRRGWGVSFTLRPLFTPGKDPLPIAQETGWAPGSVWTGAENLAPNGIRSPDRLARKESLYRLSYRAQTENKSMLQNNEEETTYKPSGGTGSERDWLYRMSRVLSKTLVRGSGGEKKKWRNSIKISRSDSRFKFLKSKDVSKTEFVFKIEGARRMALIPSDKIVRT